MKPIYKILITLSIMSYSQLAFAITPSRLTDGKVEFAIATVNENPAYSEEEKQKLIDDLTDNDETYDVIDLTPTDFEVKIAESGIKFENYSDFKACVENKEYLQEKLEDLRPSIKRKNAGNIAEVQAANDKR